MLQTLPQSDILTPNTQIPTDAVEYVNSYIQSARCKNLSIDISFMNTMDACYVSTMCSTNHYIKYPDGSINWIVSSKQTEEFTKPFSLGNAHFFVNNL